jgi:hypothetical protein
MDAMNSNWRSQTVSGTLLRKQSRLFCNYQLLGVYLAIGRNNELLLYNNAQAWFLMFSLIYKIYFMYLIQYGSHSCKHGLQKTRNGIELKFG